MERQESLMQKISPFLWFDNQAEEAAKFYASVFKNSRIGRIARYGDAGPGAKGSVMTVEFQLDGQDFVALNGGPKFKFTEAISLSVLCKTQDEIDELWKKLTQGGQEVQCGWLKDRFGLSWQVVPEVLPKMMSDPDPEKTNRVMEAVLKMKKFDIATLEKAYSGRSAAVAR
jgi:predicted 3-demethylubiquinone-9 3-methyltransferase (glyoxalase superfamily)